MEILLVRHALPERIERDDGEPADPPLSERGRRQAALLAARLAEERLDAVYASPLRRAFETAEPVARAQGCELRIEAGVSELDPHSDSYVPLEELKSQDHALYLELLRGGLTVGVDVAAFRATVTSTIEAIIAAHPSGRVAVVCHGGVINAWAAYVLGLRSRELFFFAPDYTSVSRFLAAGSGERSVASLNETAHLGRSPGPISRVPS